MDNTKDEVSLCLPPALFRLLVMKAWDNNHCLASEIVLRIKRSLELEAKAVEHSRSLMRLQRRLKSVEGKLDELGPSPEFWSCHPAHFERE